MALPPNKDVTVVTSGPRASRLRWVTLVYRVPRTPSAPRIAIWRRLRALGVAQLCDGMVALPEDGRTREHLEWVADQVIEAGGTALLFRAEAMSSDDERTVAESMSSARADEYREIAEAASAALESPPQERGRALRRLRREMRKVQRRDYFPPAERGQAVVRLSALADADLDADRTAVEVSTGDSP